MSIQELPLDVIAQIKSSTTITNLNQAVFGLLKNSLDASAAKIDITVDYGRGGCVVEDTGRGILPSEFEEGGGLGKLHCTSKLGSLTPTHGFCGTFLASLAAVSLLSIVSRHELHQSHHALSFHASRVVARQTPAPEYLHFPSFNPGTRVVVRDLFGRMPVRVRQRPAASDQHSQRAKHFEELKKGIVATLLSWPDAVCVTVREAGTKNKLQLRPLCQLNQIGNPEIHTICHVLSQAGYIEASEKSSWIRVGASTSRFSISGAISLTPSPSRQVQFVAFDLQPLMQSDGQTILYDELNRLFMNSAFGTDDTGGELEEKENHQRTNDRRYKSVGYTTKELQRGKKGIDRWPMFYLKITPAQPTKATLSSILEDVLEDRCNSLGAIIELLHAMIFEFLTKYHFQPKRVSARARTGSTKDITIRAQRSYSSPVLKAQPDVVLTPKTSQRDQVNIGSGTGNKTLLLQRRLSNIDSPFNAWSRVKVGATHSQFLTGPEVVQIHAPQIIKSTIVNSSAFDSPPNGPSERSSQPLVSKAGKLTRRPFENANMPIEADGKNSSLPEARSEDNPHGVIATWMNPFTKVTSNVDLRTGRVLPLSKEPGRALKRITTRLSEHQRESPSIESTWVRDLLDNWDNPIFRPTEQVIPHVRQEGTDAFPNFYGQYHQCSGHGAGALFSNPSTGINGRISKDSLRKARVIAQVDKKFILVKLEPSIRKDVNIDADGMLVLIDQHAADERIRIERLLAELHAPSESGSTSGISTADLDKPLSFYVSPREIGLFRDYVQHFKKWGIFYDLPIDSAAASLQKAETLIVRSLPPSILERCKLDPKLLISLLRSEAWSILERGTKKSDVSPPPVFEGSHSTSAWLQQLHNCPRGILDLLNSRACRSAIMFNDELSLDQCRILVQNLADCAFPFQCAHGRPSMVPLVNLETVAEPCRTGSNSAFGAAFSRWRSKLEFED